MNAKQEKAMKRLGKIRRYGSRFAKLAVKHAASKGEEPAITWILAKYTVRDRRAGLRYGAPTFHNLPTSQYGRLANCQSGIVLTKKGAIHETRTATDP